MKYLKYLVLGLLFLGSTVLAAPVSWDGNVNTNILQPLQAFWTTQIKGNYFTATSTTQASTFPYASTTALTATSLCFLTDCRTAWPASFGTTSDTGIGNNLFVYTSAGGILKGAASSSLNLPNAALQNSSVTVNGTSIALGASGTITAASSTLLANNNTWSGTNAFGTINAGTWNGTPITNAYLGTNSVSSSTLYATNWTAGYTLMASTTAPGGLTFVNVPGQTSATVGNTSTTSTAFGMVGMGATYKPTFSGKLLVIYQVSEGGVTAGNQAIYKMSYGTGAPPSTGDSATGTVFGPVTSFTPAAASQTVSTSLTGFVTLTVGTTYWFDLQFRSVSGTSVLANNNNVLIIEL